MLWAIGKHQPVGCGVWFSLVDSGRGVAWRVSKSIRSRHENGDSKRCRPPISGTHARLIPKTGWRPPRVHPFHLGEQPSPPAAIAVWCGDSSARPWIIFRGRAFFVALMQQVAIVTPSTNTNHDHPRTPPRDPRAPRAGASRPPPRPQSRPHLARPACAECPR